MKRHIRDFVRACDVCQRHKTETLQPAGLLHPLSVSEQIWSDIFIGFCGRLTYFTWEKCILVVVDRFSKYCHLLSTAHPYSALSIARLFFDNVSKLHGLPVSIVSDRDVTFTSAFGENSSA